MNYYDEEIIIAGPDTKNLSTVKVNKLGGGGPGGSGGSRNAAERETIGTSATSRRSNRVMQRNTLPSQSTDDDGLLEDIIDHDDEDDTDDSDHQKPITNAQKTRRSATQRPPSLRRITSSRFRGPPSGGFIENDNERSESESDEGLDAAIPIESFTPKTDFGKNGTLFNFPPPKSRIPSAATESILIKQTSIDEANTSQLDITPDKWEGLNVHQDIKDLFPYILKYTPQLIDVPYRLQPFIPEYVPAVGDVDAFLKVTTPPALDTQREYELNTHIRKLGLYYLDEPAGEQSQPSLLNMKLRSVLTGSGVNPRLASAALIPIAKSPKDIDKWIAEVEKVHMQSVHDVQPRKDIEPLLMDWPREYAIAAPAIQDAYQRCLQDDITLVEYVRALSERFNIEGRLDTQADYILNVQTLFALYLAANQAWE